MLNSFSQTPPDGGIQHLSTVLNLRKKEVSLILGRNIANIHVHH